MADKPQNPKGPEATTSQPQQTGDQTKTENQPTIQTLKAENEQLRSRIDNAAKLNRIEWDCWHRDILDLLECNSSESNKVKAALLIDLLKQRLEPTSTPTE